MLTDGAALIVFGLNNLMRGRLGVIGRVILLKVMYCVKSYDLEGVGGPPPGVPGIHTRNKSLVTEPRNKHHVIEHAS